ncbi:RHS repeat domain-containing protein, partial [Microbulbifer thermotolerans]|uniref:RHS repeat domain-containing protein n=1 Tax=Microbulbifer thermotolerans TaxID=252514 RepID=UPI00224AAD9B
NILAAAGSVEEAKQQAANTQIRGNRIAALRGKNQKLQTRYHYNSRQQLIRVEQLKLDDNGQEQLQQQTHYQYDPLGRRIAKTDSDQHTDFLWDGDLLLRETARDLNTQQQLKSRTYYFEPGTFKPIALGENGELYHYHLDHLGTPDTLTDSQGEIAWSVSYTAYGNLAIKHCNRIEQPIRFQGQYYDEETGLHYNRFRYYDPEVGAFTQQDPIGLLGGINNYQYVPNPVGWVDPLGLTCKEETQHPNVSGNSSTVNSALHAKYVDELATLNKQLLFR